jgi:hypothetical protein
MKLYAKWGDRIRLMVQLRLRQMANGGWKYPRKRGYFRIGQYTAILEEYYKYHFISCLHNTLIRI